MLSTVSEFYLEFKLDSYTTNFKLTHRCTSKIPINLQNLSNKQKHFNLLLIIRNSIKCLVTVWSVLKVCLWNEHSIDEIRTFYDRKTHCCNYLNITKSVKVQQTLLSPQIFYNRILLRNNLSALSIKIVLELSLN